MEVNGVKRRDSNHSRRSSSSTTQQPSITLNDDQDLELFKWAQTTDVRRRSSNASGHKWILDNIKDNNQSDDDDDPLGFLNETNNDDDLDDYDDSPISSRPESKSPQILFPPDSLWEESRRDSIFEQARRDSIRWVEENKQEILREMKKDEGGINAVPDTPVLKRNSYLETTPKVRLVVTSPDDDDDDVEETSDDEPAEPPGSWVANAIRRLSHSVIPDSTLIQESIEKDVSELKTRGKVALEIREIETKRRGSQTVSPDVVKIMAEWEKEHRQQSEQENTDNESETIYTERHKNSRLRKSISGTDDSEVKVIITSPDDESEEIETPSSWLTNTIRRLSNASSIDDSITSITSNSNSTKEQDSNQDNYETPTGWIATAIRRLSSTGEDSDNRMLYTKENSNEDHENSNRERKLSESNINKSDKKGSRRESLQEEYEKTGMDIRRASTGSSRRVSLKNEDRKQSIGKISAAGSRKGSYKIVTDTEGEKIDFKASRDGIDNERRTSIKRRSSQGTNRNEDEESIKGASWSSLHTDQKDKKIEADDVFSQEDTPTGWLVNAVRRLSSVALIEGSNIEESSTTVRNDDYLEASRSSSQSSVHDEQNTNDMLSPEDTPTGWLATAVRRLSSVSYENDINVKERRASTGSLNSNSDLKTNQDTHRSRHASESSLNNDTQQDSQYALSPEDTPTGWLANAVRRLSAVSVENEVITDERRASTESIQSDRGMQSFGVSPMPGRSRTNSLSNLEAQQDSKNILSPEDTPTGWLANAVRRLSSVSIENDDIIDEKRSSMGNAHNLEGQSSPRSHKSRSPSSSSPRSKSPSNNLINIDSQQDSKDILSPEDTPTGWLANAVRRLSSFTIENDDTNEERRSSTGNAHHFEGQSSPGSHRSRSPSSSSPRPRSPNSNLINLDAQQDSNNLLSSENTPTGWLAGAVRRLSSVAIDNDITTEKEFNLGRQNSHGTHRSRSSSRDPVNIDEQNNSQNILSPEDTPKGWLANAVRRLSSASREDIDNIATQQLSESDQINRQSFRNSFSDVPVSIPSPGSSPTPPDTPPPTVPYASSEEEEEEEESQEYLTASTLRRLSSISRGSVIPPIDEEQENDKESFSSNETQQLHSNQNWMTSAIRRLSMRDEEPIKLPLTIKKNTSEMIHQNIVKPMVNEDSNEDDYTPVLISNKKTGKGLAWQNGFDWDSTQGTPDVTFCGCGFLGIYMVGVAEVLLEERPELLQGRIAGSSVGSLVAACIVTGVSLQKLRQSLLHVADLSQAYTLGPLNPWFNLEEPLLEGLLEMMPHDAHIKASGRLFLSLTRLSNLSNEVVSEYPTRDELLRAILCCCWLPGISSFTAPTFMGTSYIDGAFSSVNPWYDVPNNLSVSAYSGTLTICPDDSDLYPYQPQYAVLGASYNMQPENGKRAVDALMPPSGDGLDKYYHNGVYDTHIFLRNLKG